MRRKIYDYNLNQENDYAARVIDLLYLGGEYTAAGRFDKLIELYQKEYDDIKKQTGKDNDSTVLILKALAVACWRSQQIENGREVYGRIYEILKELKGEDDAETVDAKKRS